MSSSIRHEALAVLAELCSLAPDIRLGQLLAQIGFLGQDRTGLGLWDIEDEQFLDLLYRHRGELESRLRQPGETSDPARDEATPTAS